MKRTINLPGLTLIELLVSIVIASFIGLAAISATTTAISLMRSNERVMETNDTAKSLIEYIVSRTQGAGGGQVRPWFALRVTDDCEGSGSDCLLVFEADFDVPECPIVSATSTQLNSNADGAGNCCITDGYIDRPVMVIDSSGDLVGAFQGHTVSNANTTTNCNLSFPSARPRLAAPEYNSPQGQPTDGVVSAPITGAANGWLVTGKFVRYRLNEVADGVGAAREKLMIDTMDENSSTAFTFESRVADSPVHDLQFALGYDADGSGVVTENGTTGDEFLHNATGDSFGGGGLNGNQDDDLRLLGIGVTVGAETTQLGGNVVRLFNGTNRQVPGAFLRGTTGRAYLRNLNIFF